MAKGYIDWFKLAKHKFIRRRTFKLFASLMSLKPEGNSVYNKSG